MANRQRGADGDGQRWARVVVNGLDNLNNSRTYGLIVAADWLYLVCTNYNGAEVWRSSNGLDWDWTNRPGWDDPGNTFADYFDKGAVMFHGDLYVGTSHDAGGEVWRLRLAPRIYLPVVMKGYGPEQLVWCIVLRA